MYQAYSKSLITGSYAITEPGHHGIALGLTPSFYAYKHQDLTGSNIIRIITPQFPDDYLYEYNYNVQEITEISSETENLNGGKAIKLSIENPLGTSRFIESIVRVTLTYLLSQNLLKKSGVSVEVFEDKEFISEKFHKKTQPMCEVTSLGAGDRSLHYQLFDRNINEVTKTGLGSSACLIISVLGILANELSGNDPTFTQKKIEILGQIINSLAQKKIGSGFDIACAVFGSIVYTKMDAAKFSSLITLMEEISDSIDTSHPIPLVIFCPPQTLGHPSNLQPTSPKPMFFRKHLASPRAPPLPNHHIPAKALQPILRRFQYKFRHKNIGNPSKDPFYPKPSIKDQIPQNFRVNDPKYS
jgi:phosphomevalonate kinase